MWDDAPESKAAGPGGPCRCHQLVRTSHVASPMQGRALISLLWQQQEDAGEGTGFTADCGQRGGSCLGGPGGRAAGSTYQSTVLRSSFCVPNETSETAQFEINRTVKNRRASFHSRAGAKTLTV